MSVQITLVTDDKEKAIEQLRDLAGILEMGDPIWENSQKGFQHPIRDEGVFVGTIFRGLVSTHGPAS